MSKQAFLVDYSIRTRVVVDIPDNIAPDSDEWFNIISKEARRKADDFVKSGDSPFIGENVTEINPDSECPAGTFKDEEKRPSIGDQLRSALKALMDVQNSSYIPFTSPAPCSTEVAIRNDIITAYARLASAVTLHEHMFGKK